MAAMPLVAAPVTVKLGALAPSAASVKVRVPAAPASSSMVAVVSPPKAPASSTWVTVIETVRVALSPLAASVTV